MSTTDRARAFFRVRVGVLLTVLFVVLAWAVRDVRSRRGRTAWDHTLSVAVVIVARTQLDAGAVAALHARRSALEQRLTAELRRYRPGAPPAFAFHVLGPTPVSEPLPQPSGDALLDLSRHAYAQWRYLRAIDAAVGLDTSAYDSRIYLLASAAHPDEPASVEGASEQGGRVGTVSVGLDAAMADFALIVVAHELFHTLGATDKYDERGRARVPDGLAEPDASPLFPQRYVEIMARNRPVSSREERPPEGIHELAVGKTTARELGWDAPP